MSRLHLLQFKLIIFLQKLLELSVDVSIPVQPLKEEDVDLENTGPDADADDENNRGNRNRYRGGKKPRKSFGYGKVTTKLILT